MSGTFPFKRLLLKLPQRQTDPAVLQAAVSFAELLKLRLTAEFIEDAELLLGLQGIPGLRELRSLSGSWQPIDAGQWRNEMNHAASNARKLFEEMIRNRPINADFRPIQGGLSALITEADPEDIVVVIQPRNPAERISQQFSDLVEAAFRTQAAVMMLPASVARITGPVVAIATHATDPSISTAIGIAAAAGEDVILVPTYVADGDHPSIGNIADRAGVRMQMSMPIDLVGDEAFCFWPRHKERVIVMTRELSSRVLPLLKRSIQQVPILIVGSEKSTRNQDA